MHTNKIYRKALFLCAPLLLLSACVSAPSYQTQVQSPRVDTASSAPGTIGENAQFAQMQGPTMQEYPESRIAILLPLSGPNKDLGNAMLNAAQMALFEVGYPKLKLIPRDTQGTAEGARAAAKSATQEGAQLILGPVFASSVKAAAPIARRRNVNMIAFSTDWSLAEDNTFIMGFLPFDQIDRVTRYISQKNFRDIGIIAPDTGYGQTVSQEFQKAAMQNGIMISNNMSFPARTANLAPAIEQFSSQSSPNMQAVFMPTGGEQAQAIANLLSHNNLPPRKVTRIGTGLLDDPALAKEKNLEGALFAAPAPQARQKYEQRYTQTFGQPPLRLSTLSYDAVALAATLARRGYDFNLGGPAFDRNALTNANGFLGIDGIFRFRPDGIAQRGLAVLSYRNGQITIVDKAPTTFQGLQ